MTVTVLEILGAPYEIKNPKLQTTDDLIDYYVGTYDELLSKKYQKNFSFGYESPDGSKNQNSLEMVKSQKNLLTVFTKTVEMLAESNGLVSSELSRVCTDFNINGLFEGQPISSHKAREILKAVSLGVIGSIATVDKEILEELESPSCGYDASYDTAAYSSNQASTNGDTYNTLCPTFGMSSGKSESQLGEESRALLLVYGVHDKLGNFGKPKIGVCRISNCPSRGNSKYIHEKTLVGICDVCVHCHKLYEKGKIPDKVYDEKTREDQRKQKQAEEENLRIERQRIEWVKRKAARKKRRTESEMNIQNDINQKSIFQELEEMGGKAA